MRYGFGREVQLQTSISSRPHRNWKIASKVLLPRVWRFFMPNLVVIGQSQSDLQSLKGRNTRSGENGILSPGRPQGLYTFVHLWPSVSQPAPRIFSYSFHWKNKHPYFYPAMWKSQKTWFWWEGGYIPDQHIHIWTYTYCTGMLRSWFETITDRIIAAPFSGCKLAD